MGFVSELSGFPAFALYFVGALLFLIIFKTIYTTATPYDEWKLIKEEKNVAASISFSGALIGFSLAVSSAAENSVDIIDFLIWGLVALVAQLIAFGLVRILFMPKISKRIEANELPAGIILAAISICVGLLNAACMSY